MLLLTEGCVSSILLAQLYCLFSGYPMPSVQVWRAIVNLVTFELFKELDSYFIVLYVTDNCYDVELSICVSSLFPHYRFLLL